jgi:Glyoxalase/Bleomycin resistance protein/Dioxygenase superfamily
MSAAVQLDHLAIAVERWADGYPRFVVELGGGWSHGGESGPFAPCQLDFAHGMRLELIAPNGTEGFMRRFLDQHGPGAHHLTFTVPSLDDALAAVGELGIEVLGGRTSMPFWQEAFLHPKLCGVGTLVQFVQKDDVFMDAVVEDSTEPPDFPPHRGEQQAVAWVGLTTASLDRAEALFVGALQGAVDRSGPGWMLVVWGPGRALLVREPSAAPGGDLLWAGAPALGVAHVVMGPAELRPQHVETSALDVRLLPHDERTGTPVLIARPAGAVAAASAVEPVTPASR